LDLKCREISVARCEVEPELDWRAVLRCVHLSGCVIQPQSLCPSPSSRPYHIGGSGCAAQQTGRPKRRNGSKATFRGFSRCPLCPRKPPNRSTIGFGGRPAD